MRVLFAIVLMTLSLVASGAPTTVTLRQPRVDGSVTTGSKALVDTTTKELLDSADLSAKGVFALDNAPILQELGGRTLTPADQSRLRLIDARTRMRAKKFDEAINLVAEDMNKAPAINRAERALTLGQIAHQAWRADALTTAITEMEKVPNRGALPRVTATGVETSEKDGADQLELLKLLRYERSLVDAQSSAASPPVIEELLGSYTPAADSPLWLRNRWLRYRASSIRGTVKTHGEAGTVTLANAHAVEELFLEANAGNHAEANAKVSILRERGDWLGAAEAGWGYFQEWHDFLGATLPIERADGTKIWRRYWNAPSLRLLVTTASAYRRAGFEAEAKACLEPVVTSDWFRVGNEVLASRITHPSQNLAMYHGWLNQEYRAIASGVDANTTMSAVIAAIPFE